LEPTWAYGQFAYFWIPYTHLFIPQRFCAGVGLLYFDRKVSPKHSSANGAFGRLFYGTEPENSREAVEMVKREGGMP